MYKNTFSGFNESVSKAPLPLLNKRKKDLSIEITTFPSSDIDLSRVILPAKRNAAPTSMIMNKLADSFDVFYHMRHKLTPGHTLAF